MKQESTTITLDGIEFDVDYTYSPPYRGARDSLNGVRGAGPPLEPDEDEEVEINYVFHAGEDIYDFLSEETFRRIEEAIFEKRRNPDYDPD
jgi:hypothetical protein